MIIICCQYKILAKILLRLTHSRPAPPPNPRHAHFLSTGEAKDATKMKQLLNGFFARSVSKNPVYRVKDNLFLDKTKNYGRQQRGE